MAENKIRCIDSTVTKPTATRAQYGPNAAGIEYDKGRNGLALNPDGTVRLHPDTWVETFSLAGASAATAANFRNFYIAPFGVEVVSVKARFSVASTSGTLMINKAASGTDTDSGTAVLASTMSLAGTAHTNVSGTLHATVGNRKLSAGDSLGVVDGGTLTNLTDLVVMVELKRRPDVA